VEAIQHTVPGGHGRDIFDQGIGGMREVYRHSEVAHAK
jgi:hypothetical protein